jgi:hypothetical protein
MLNGLLDFLRWIFQKVLVRLFATSRESGSCAAGHPAKEDMSRMPCC